MPPQPFNDSHGQAAASPLLDVVVGRKSILFGAVALFLAAEAGEAVAAPVACPPQPIRWADDCSGLAGKSLTGLDRLRYLPLGENGAWLTLGGEARARTEDLDPPGFGVGRYHGHSYVEVAARGLFSADLHFTPRLRVFGQLGVTDQHGRFSPRTRDQDRLDAAQLFVDLPAPGPVNVFARLGRQEINLSDNRLIATRDGITMRRSFQGALVSAERWGGRLTAMRGRPMELERGYFDDTFQRGEVFQALSLDLPSTHNVRVNAFLFDRLTDDVDFRDFVGAERRYSGGLHALANAGLLNADGQVTLQWGKTRTGEPISASSVSTVFTYGPDAPHDPRLVATLAYATGDAHVGDGKLNTFDPLYPNNFGLSSAPFLFQTNYEIAGVQGLARFGPTDFGVGGFYLTRFSNADVLYFEHEQLPGTDGPERKTAVMLQANARTALGRRAELGLVAVDALVGDNIKAAGGRNTAYLRVDLVTRF